MKYKEVAGGHGVVRLYKSYAVKIVNNISIGVSIKEIVIMRHLNHPHLNRYIRVSCRKRMHIKMPLYECDLADLAETMPIWERMALLDQLFIPLFGALLHMKQKGVVHMDLKMRNIFYDHSKLVIGDFSSACFIGIKPAFSSTTLKYVPPEGDSLDYATDVYMMGSVILFFLLGKFHRVWDENGEMLLLDFDKLQEKYDSKVLRVVAGMVRKDPANRPSIEQLCAILGVAAPEQVPDSAPKQFLEGGNEGRAPASIAELTQFLRPRNVSQKDELVYFMRCCRDPVMGIFLAQALFEVDYFDLELLLRLKKVSVKNLYRRFWRIFKKWHLIEHLLDLHYQKYIK